MKSKGRKLCKMEQNKGKKGAQGMNTGTGLWQTRKISFMWGGGGNILLGPIYIQTRNSTCVGPI